MFGLIPSSSFYIRHAKNIEISDVDISFMQPDFRPSIQLDDVKGSIFRNVRITQPDAPKKFVLINSDEPIIK